MRLADARAYVALGANQGDPQAALAAALRALAALPGTHLLRASAFYRTQPVDASGPDYLNAVAELHTSLSPHGLLAELQRIETSQGRERPYRNAPRTLDLDLLVYGDEIVDTRFFRNKFGCQRIISSHHHGFNSHFTQTLKTFFHSGFDNVL